METATTAITPPDHLYLSPATSRVVVPCVTERATSYAVSCCVLTAGLSHVLSAAATVVRFVFCGGGASSYSCASAGSPAPVKTFSSFKPMELVLKALVRVKCSSSEFHLVVEGTYKS
jgi:hypothetical protein